MKNILKILSGVGLGVAITLGGVALSQDAPISDVSTKDVALYITEVNDAGRVRYDVHDGELTYHFWDKTQLEEFANNKDEDDNEQTALARQILKSELTEKGVDALITKLERPVVYSISAGIQEKQ